MLNRTTSLAGIDPFDVKKRPKLSPSRVICAALARVAELDARSNFEHYALPANPLLARSDFSFPEFMVENQRLPKRAVLLSVANYI